MQNSENITGEGTGGEECDACAPISFNDVIRRMVTYVTAHNFDEDETTCILIFKIMRNHMLKVIGERGGWRWNGGEMARLSPKLNTNPDAPNAPPTHPGSHEGR